MKDPGSLRLGASDYLVHIEIVGGDHAPVVPAPYFAKEIIIGGAGEVELVIEHQKLGLRLRRNLRELIGRRVGGGVIRLPTRWQLGKTFGRVHLVQQDVASHALARYRVARPGVAGDDDGAVRGFHSVTERMRP